MVCLFYSFLCPCKPLNECLQTTNHQHAGALQLSPLSFEHFPLNRVTDI